MRYREWRGSYPDLWELNEGSILSMSADEADRIKDRAKSALSELRHIIKCTGGPNCVVRRMAIPEDFVYRLVFLEMLINDCTTRTTPQAR